jgi:CRP-like cAMP-binding protein
MILILDGTVRVSLKGVILADLAAGTLLGQVALLDGGKKRSADATALTRCELVVLERRDFVAVLEKRSDVCLKLLELMSARLRKSDRRMSDLGFHWVWVRLAKVLLDRTLQAALAGAESKISVSQIELARVIQAEREAVNRCLHNWQRQGILDLDNRERWIIVRQREALAAIAEYS